MRLIIYFDGQFWAGIIERFENNNFVASRYIFGAEPKDGDIEKFVLEDLIKFLGDNQGSKTDEQCEIKKNNPKRLKKLAAREIDNTPVSTKAQQALQAALEENKKAKALISKQQKLEHEKYKRIAAIEKKKKKHRGH